MMIHALLSAALLAGAAPSDIKVDVGRADWKALPQIHAVQRELPTPNMVSQVEQILASGKCSLPGQSQTHFDITVPFAAFVEPDGSTRHVVVGETGCADLETYVGLLVLERARQRDFMPTGRRGAHWFAGEMNFNLQ
jgi:hypothetical protein